MPETSYHIKFYGHLGRDNGLFARQLASALGVDEAAAKLLMENVPVVVRSGLGKDRANLLRDQLSAIGALTLIESVDSSTGPISERSQQRHIPVQPPVSTNAEESVLGVPNLWIFMFVAAVGLSLAVASVLIATSYRKLAAELRPAIQLRQQVGDTETTTRQPFTSTALTKEDLTKEIDTQKDRTDRLKLLADMNEQEMHATYGVFGINPEVGREAWQRWQAAQEELDSANTRLNYLKTRLRREESSRAGS